MKHHALLDNNPLKWSDEQFDIYERSTSRRLKENENFKRSKNIKVFCCEPYAKDTYSAYTSNHKLISLDDKDDLTSDMFNLFNLVSEMVPCVRMNEQNPKSYYVYTTTTNGCTYIVDLSKEKLFVERMFGIKGESSVGISKELRVRENTPDMNAVFTTCIQSMHVFLYVDPYGNVSLDKPIIHNSTKLLRNEATSKKKNLSFDATIASVNRGGFDVEIFGIKCFLPFSQSEIEFSEDYSNYFGQSIKVLVQNISQQGGFVVSAKTYKQWIAKLDAEYLVAKDGQPYDGVVTGILPYGIFVDFHNPNPSRFDTDENRITQTGLIHASGYSQRLEMLVEKGMIGVGDPIVVYIMEIIDETNYNRILLSDIPPKDENALSTTEDMLISSNVVVPHSTEEL